MKVKLLWSTLCLLSVSALFTNSAIAQSGDYVGCVKYAKENLNPSLISVHLGEQGSALISVNINTEGNVTECTVVKGSGSERTDTASCDWVKGHWRMLRGCSVSKGTKIDFTKPFIYDGLRQQISPNPQDHPSVELKAGPGAGSAQPQP